MNFSKMVPFMGLASVLAFSALGETPVTSLDTTVTTAPAARPGRIVGTADLRPSYGSKIGEFHSENYLQAGYEFNPQLQVHYRQEFNTNFYSPITSQQGLNLVAKSGFARVKVNDIWKSGPTSFSFESRLYVPTDAVKRDAGMILAARNYARLKQKITQDFALTLEEYPIFHVYNQAAFKKVANPWFENRVALTAEYFPLEKVKILVPMYLESTRFRESAGARNSEKWSHKVYIWPEIDYIINPQLSVGVAYYSAPLFKDDLSDSNFSNGFEQGITQFVVQAQL